MGSSREWVNGPNLELTPRVKWVSGVWNPRFPTALSSLPKQTFPQRFIDAPLQFIASGRALPWEPPSSTEWPVLAGAWKRFSGNYGLVADAHGLLGKT